VIAVRVYSFIYDGGLIGPAADMRLHPVGAPAAALPLAGSWRHRCEHNLGLIVPPGALMGHGEPNSPHILFDNMIAPLVPYALRGAIWYQGESNESAPHLYSRLLRDLIEDWRRHWGLPALAFHLVQLPGFRQPQAYEAESKWARLREAQASVLLLPQTGMAVVIEFGEAGDIHPKNKIPVGERLAQSALAVTYARPLAPCGPLADKFTVTGNALRCDFRFAETGLATLDGAAPSHFFVAGEDGIFHPASARIEESSVVVTSPAVPKPVAVRYAWADNPEGCNLASAEKLPASPFRSDRW
jgi:sialate O-acetylesterase